MCEPTTIALLVGQAAAAATATTAATAATAGLIGAGGSISAGVLAGASVASTMAGLYGQQQAASAQSATNERQYENTMVARDANINQTNLMGIQSANEASQKSEQNDRAARQAKATATVAAGENGVSGLSVDALLADLSGKQAQYNAGVQNNLDNKNMAIEGQRMNINTDAKSRINALKTPQMPDYFGAALKIGTTYQDYRKPKI